MKPTRDQARAAHAYQVVGNLRKDDIKNFKIVVNSFGATVLKGGPEGAAARAESAEPNDFRSKMTAADSGAKTSAPTKSPAKATKAEDEDDESATFSYFKKLTEDED